VVFFVVYAEVNRWLPWPGILADRALLFRHFWSLCKPFRMNAYEKGREYSCVFVRIIMVNQKFANSPPARKAAP
jgi:hypothetical protein